MNRSLFWMMFVSIGLLMSEGRKYLIVKDESHSNDQMSPASFTNPFEASFRTKKPKCSADVMNRKCDPARANSQCTDFKTSKPDTGMKYNGCKCKKIHAAGNKKRQGRCGHRYY